MNPRLIVSTLLEELPGVDQQTLNKIMDIILGVVDRVKSGNPKVDRSRFEQEVNPFVQQGVEHRTFFTRLHHFVLASDAFIVAPGGIGTLLELFYSWQLVQVGHICKTPIILYGDIWRPLLHWLNEEVLRRGFISVEDLQGVFVLDSVPGVVELIHRIHEDRSRSANVCVNFDKYRV